MKKSLKKIVSLFLCLALVFSIGCTGVYAAQDVEETPEVETEEVEKSPIEGIIDVVADPALWEGTIAQLEGIFGGVGSDLSFADNIMKVLYNVLNIVVEELVQAICKIYPNPNNWQALADYDSDEVGFMDGRDTYQTSAAQGNYWSLGYASRSLLPEDIDNGKYYIGRDLMNKKAIGVYDDMRIRVAVVDDNSGEGAVVIGAIDCLGVTSTDVRSIRKGVLEYCAKNNIDVASINIMATHAHSALDTQGVSTEFFYKLLANGFANALGIFDELPFMETASAFKEYFVEQSIIAVEEAFEDVEKGELYYSAIDCSEFVKDKRGLLAKEDIPKIAGLYFVPDSGSEVTYIADITCHATSFSASNSLVGSDYIYYLDKYIKETNGGNVVMIPGAVGQMSRDLDVDDTGLTEWEAKGSSAKALGRKFGEVIVGADYSEKLAPVLNATHREIVIHPENSILVLACEVKLVNNKVFVDEDGNAMMPTEMGYVEFGNRVGLALFPAELYPEVFWGHEITNYTNWDGTEWTYESLADSVEGVDVYAVSLANDALGYVLTDNNFAFMGHIIGEEIADETLSVGKHMGSYLVGEYYAMIEEMK